MLQENSAAQIKAEKEHLQEMERRLTDEMMQKHRSVLDSVENVDKKLNELKEELENQSEEDEEDEDEKEEMEMEDASEMDVTSQTPIDATQPSIMPSQMEPSVEEPIPTQPTMIKKPSSKMASQDLKEEDQLKLPNKKQTLELREEAAQSEK